MNTSVENNITIHFPSHSERWLEDSLDQALGNKPDFQNDRLIPDFHVHLPKGCHVHC